MSIFKLALKYLLVSASLAFGIYSFVELLSIPIIAWLVIVGWILVALSVFRPTVKILVLSIMPFAAASIFIMLQSATDIALAVLVFSPLIALIIRTLLQITQKHLA